MRGMRALVLIFCIACGSSSKPTTTPKPVPNAELSPALEPLAWWLGDWQVERGATGEEHWVAASGVIFGIALQGDADSSFEVMVIDDGEGPGKADGVLRFLAMPGGMKSVEFRANALQMQSATFANPAHDFPKMITYAAVGEALTAKVEGDGKSESFKSKRITAPRAQVLEDADKAFAADTAARGIEGWVAAFDDKGGMMTKNGRVEGHAAIRELMSGLLASTKVEWAPIASAVRGDIGYTVGKATFTGKEDSWRSTYVTIWKKQPDGTWKVLFDTGRTVQAE
jgi:ketosteroid isomerase-like protein